MIEINCFGLIGLFFVFAIIGYVIGQVDYKIRNQKGEKNDFQKTEEGISTVCKSAS